MKTIFIGVCDLRGCREDVCDDNHFVINVVDINCQLVIRFLGMKARRLIESRASNSC